MSAIGRFHFIMIIIIFWNNLMLFLGLPLFYRVLIYSSRKLVLLAIYIYIYINMYIYIYIINIYIIIYIIIIIHIIQRYIILYSINVFSIICWQANTQLWHKSIYTHNISVMITIQVTISRSSKKARGFKRLKLRENLLFNNCDTVRKSN